MKKPIRMKAIDLLQECGYKSVKKIKLMMFLNMIHINGRRAKYLCEEFILDYSQCYAVKIYGLLEIKEFYLDRSLFE